MDETTPLIGTQLLRPQTERRSTLVTIAGAGNNFRLIQKRSRSILEKSYVDLLLIFVPLGVVASFVKWPADIVFALNFVALISLENVFHLLAERLFLPWGDRPGTVLSVVLPHVFPLFVSFQGCVPGIDLQADTIRLVQPQLGTARLSWLKLS